MALATRPVSMYNMESAHVAQIQSSLLIHSHGGDCQRPYRAVYNELKLRFIGRIMNNSFALDDIVQHINECFPVLPYRQNTYIYKQAYRLDRNNGINY